MSILLIVTLGVWLSLPSSRESPIDQAERMLSIRLPQGTTQLLQAQSGAGIPFPGGVSDAVFKMVLIVPVDQRSPFAEALAQSDLWQSLPVSGEYASLAKFNLSKLEGRTDEVIASSWMVANARNPKVIAAIKASEKETQTNEPQPGAPGYRR